MSLQIYDDCMEALEDYCNGNGTYQVHLRFVVNYEGATAYAVERLGNGWKGWSYLQLLRDEAMLEMLGCLDSGLL
jgi:hypothetical protein